MRSRSVWTEPILGRLETPRNHSRELCLERIEQADLDGAVRSLGVGLF